MPVQCTCARCGAAFSVVPAQVERGKGRFCSRACADAERRLQVERQCPTCRVVFLVKRSFVAYGKGIYCSNSCRAAASKVPTVDAVCQRCGVPFALPQWRATKGEGRFCSTTCRDVSDTESRPYYGASWVHARRQARARDGRCLDCGILPSALKRALDVHHVVPFRDFGVDRHQEANDLTNLVSLCQTCHQKREWATNWRRRTL